MATLNFGLVSTFLTNDIERLLEALNNLHQIFIAPIILTIYSGIIIWKIGWIGIIIIAILIIIAIGIRWFTQRMMVLTKERIGESDKRVKMVTEGAEKIRYIKMNGYDALIEGNIERVRYKESKLNGRMYMERAYFDAMIELMPSLLIVLILSIHYSITSTLYDISLIYSLISIFNLCLIPLKSFFSAYNSLINAVHALNRIQEIYDEKRYWRGVGGMEIGKIVADGASFRVKALPSPLFPSLTLTIPPSTRVGIYGRVGSGKSLLLKSIMGELEITAGKVEWGGKGGYCPQDGFIIDSTIRDNILMGEDYDKEFYDRIIRACCLEEDLQSFALQDLSPAGENGSKLSGGQKQRVCLARALYSRADIYYLDDPLSALDGNVSIKIFNNIMDDILVGKTVIMTSNDTDRSSRYDITLHVDNLQIINMTSKHLSTPMVDNRPESSDRMDYIDHGKSGDIGMKTDGIEVNGNDGWFYQDKEGEGIGVEGRANRVRSLKVVTRGEGEFASFHGIFLEENEPMEVEYPSPHQNARPLRNFNGLYNPAIEAQDLTPDNLTPNPLPKKLGIFYIDKNGNALNSSTDTHPIKPPPLIIQPAELKPLPKTMKSGNFEQKDGKSEFSVQNKQNLISKVRIRDYREENYENTEKEVPVLTERVRLVEDGEEGLGKVKEYAVPPWATRLNPKHLKHPIIRSRCISRPLFPKLSYPGPILFFLTLFLWASFTSLKLFFDYWLGKWTNDPLKTYPSTLLPYLYVAIGIFGGILLVLGARGYGYAKIVERGGQRIHCALVSSLLRRGIGYFDATPTGEVVGRVTKDIGVIDAQFAMNGLFFLTNAMQFIGFIVLVGISVPPVLIGIAVLVVPGAVIISKYGKAGVNLRKVTVQTTGPMLGGFREIMVGNDVIRIAGEKAQNLLRDRVWKRIDDQSNASIHELFARQWANVWIELLVSLSVGMVAAMCALVSTIK